MKRLSKIKLHNAVVLENREMKMIFGGSGSSNGCNSANGYVCDDTPCSVVHDGKLFLGRCKWVETSIGKFCGCEQSSSGSGSLL